MRGIFAAMALVGCSHTYHPETRYSFVQNISYGEPEDRCKLGRTTACLRECFEVSRGEACYVLGVMFATGHGVPRRHDDALALWALADRLGYGPASIDVEMATAYLELSAHDKAKAAPSYEAPKGPWRPYPFCCSAPLRRD